MTWNKQHQSCKTTFYHRAFLASEGLGDQVEQMDDRAVAKKIVGYPNYQTWNNKFLKTITGRNRLKDAYDVFGLLVFVDTFWLPASLNPNYSSADFATVFKDICQKIPRDPTDNKPLNQSRYKSSVVAIKGILRSFDDGLASRILNFHQSNPPKVYTTMELDQVAF
ncbi:hypothetical protein C8R43DRAFT_958413 [Mycena crocata]|nr:hypothetical protein C8R43DRAFT_958413 [Mycena crocata]